MSSKTPSASHPATDHALRTRSGIAALAQASNKGFHIRLGHSQSGTGFGVEDTGDQCFFLCRARALSVARSSSPSSMRTALRPATLLSPTSPEQENHGFTELAGNFYDGTLAGHCA